MLFASSLHFDEDFAVEFLLFDNFLRGLAEKVDPVLHLFLSFCQDFLHLGGERGTFSRWWYSCSLTSGWDANWVLEQGCRVRVWKGKRGDSAMSVEIVIRIGN